MCRRLGLHVHYQDLLDKALEPCDTALVAMWADVRGRPENKTKEDKQQKYYRRTYIMKNKKPEETQVRTVRPVGTIRTKTLQR